MVYYKTGKWKVRIDGKIIVESEWMRNKIPYIAVLSIDEKGKIDREWVERSYSKKGRKYKATFVLGPLDVPDGSMVKFGLADSSDTNRAEYYAEIDRFNKGRPFKIVAPYKYRDIMWERYKKSWGK